MTCYLANHQKAKHLVAKREVELRHAIRHGFSREKIAKTAEKFRDARLKVFKSEFSRDSVLPASSYVPGKEAQAWESMPVDEIIRQFENA